MSQISELIKAVYATGGEPLFKGDLPGHEFRGNQWTGGNDNSDHVTQSDVDKSDDLAQQKYKDYYTAQESGAKKEELEILWQQATEQNNKTRELRGVLIQKENAAIADKKEAKLNEIKQSIKSGKKIDWNRDWQADTRVLSIEDAQREIDYLRQNASKNSRN